MITLRPALTCALILGSLTALTSPSRAADPFDQSAVPLEVDAADPALAKIVLLAGTPSNKTGQHEYFAGCALLMKWLKATPGVWPVMARDGWPKNEKIFEKARAVVYFGDGGGKQPFLDADRWQVLKRTMAGDTGFVLLHQAVDFPLGPQTDQVQSWLGGVFLKDIGCRGHWDMEFSRFPVPTHPVMRGMKPFKAPGDGWLYHLHFSDTKDFKSFTPLIEGAVPDKSRTSADAKRNTGHDEIVGWAFERLNGGRGFSYTGCDLHKNWDLESQRKLVVNGILWSAKVEIPDGGAKVDFDPAELNLFLDDKRHLTAAGTPKADAKKPAAPKK